MLRSRAAFALLALVLVTCSPDSVVSPSSAGSGQPQAAALTPAQGIQNLLSDIGSLGLPKGVANSLRAPLHQALTLLSDNNPHNDVAVCNKVGAFIHEVEAKSKSGTLTPAQGNQLLQAGRAIEVSLGCGVPEDPESDCENGPVATNRIAFTTNRDGNYEIYLISPDGSAQTRLTNHPALDLSPAWSPDRTKIAFMSERDGNQEIYVMNSDGSCLVNLTNHPEASEYYPAWSPDGSQIAYTSNQEGEDIFVMNADGSGQTNLTNSVERDAYPSWSPDGSKIAFHIEHDDFSGADIYVMDADGSNRVQLTTTPGYDYYPGWSPTGTQIAFFGGTSQSEVFVMNVDGSARTNLTNDPSADAWFAWSPDAARIVFCTERLSPGRCELFLMNADGSGQTRLTNDLVADDAMPSW